MKAILATTAALLAILLLIPGAQAQQSAALVVALGVPEEALGEGAETITFVGRVTLTVDYTAILSPTGIPVTYTVTKQPEWASVIVSPSSDVFPAPTAPSGGMAYQAERAITITVTLAHEVTEDMRDEVEITASTTPAMLGKSATGKGSTLVAVVAPEEACPEHAGLTPAQMALAADAVDAYNEYQAAKEDDASDEVTTQSAGASPVPLAGVALGGFALAGAIVGLVLRRRLRV